MKPGTDPLPSDKSLNRVRGIFDLFGLLMFFLSIAMWAALMDSVPEEQIRADSLFFGVSGLAFLIQSFLLRKAPRWTLVTAMILTFLAALGTGLKAIKLTTVAASVVSLVFFAAFLYCFSVLWRRYRSGSAGAAKSASSETH